MTCSMRSQHQHQHQHQHYNATQSTRGLRCIDTDALFLPTECVPLRERRSSWISSRTTRYHLLSPTNRPIDRWMSWTVPYVERQTITLFSHHKHRTELAALIRYGTDHVGTTGVADKGACRGEGGYPSSPAATYLWRKANVRTTRTIYRRIFFVE